jgi:hypothetical protein
MHEAAYHSETGQRMPAHLPTPLPWRVSLWVCAALIRSPTHAIGSQINRRHYFISLLFPRPKVVSEVLFTWPCLSRSDIRHRTASPCPSQVPCGARLFRSHRRYHVLLLTVPIAAVLPCLLYISLLCSPFSVHLYFMIYLALI